MHFGYLPDFYYSEPAIVLLGDELSLSKLVQFLREIATRPSFGPIALSELSFMRPWRRTHIILNVSGRALGMKRAAGSAAFTWHLSQETAQRFADLVDGVATSVGPSHNYLETDASDEIVVIVSKGEHPTDILMTDG